MENKTGIMKHLSLLGLFAIVLVNYSCDSKKAAAENPISVTKSSAPILCPEDGVCSVQLFRNKSLDIKTDELGSTYYQMPDSDQTSVILYRYRRNVEKGLQDGQYTEEIIFEVNNSESTANYSDLDLQKTKMLFGRLCFCRGQTGYYKVTAGNLKLNQKNNEVKFNLDFKISKVPQIIYSINTSVK
jgi:hypothetical protein